MKSLAWFWVGFGTLVLVGASVLVAFDIVPGVAVSLGLVLGVWPLLYGLWRHGDRMYVDHGGLSRCRYGRLMQRIEWSRLAEVSANLNSSRSGPQGAWETVVDGYVFFVRTETGKVDKLPFEPMVWARRDAFYASFAPILRARPDLVTDDRLWPYFEKHVERFVAGTGHTQPPGV